MGRAQEKENNIQKMKQINVSELGSLHFDSKGGSQKITAQAPKIAWLHSKADNPGAKFDFTVKDSLGRIMLEKKNCGNETRIYGELINLPIHLGEELEIIVDNMRGTENLDLFIN